MLIKDTDLTRYLYLPNRGITLAISGSTTSGDTISTADAQRYMMEAEAKVNRAFGAIPFAFTRLAAALSALGTSITTDTQDGDDWETDGYIFLMGVNIAYTSRTATYFLGLTATLGVPAAPIGAFVTGGDSSDTSYGNTDADATQAELYRRLEITCKLAAYEIWKLRFNAEAMPSVVTEWRDEAMKELYKSLSGEGYAHP